MSSILNVNTIQNATGTTAMGIDSNGIVTRNLIPAWGLHLSGNYSGTQAGGFFPITQWIVSADVNESSFLQGGCSLNTGVITVPITGLNNITTTTRFDSMGGNYCKCAISINDEDDTNTLNKYGGGQNIVGESSLDHRQTPKANLVAKLTANDTVRIKVLAASDTAWTVLAQESIFQGYLIG